MPRLSHAWYDLPLRTILVCGLMAAIIEASTWAGPMVTGLLAVFPISSTSLILILHPRIGGRASAAVLANSVWSLFGISFGLAAIALAVVPLGVPVALAAALAIPHRLEFDRLADSPARCIRRRRSSMMAGRYPHTAARPRKQRQRRTRKVGEMRL